MKFFCVLLSLIVAAQAATIPTVTILKVIYKPSSTALETPSGTVPEVVSTSVPDKDKLPEFAPIFHYSSSLAKGKLNAFKPSVAPLSSFYLYHSEGFKFCPITGSELSIVAGDLKEFFFAVGHFIRNYDPYTGTPLKPNLKVKVATLKTTTTVDITKAKPIYCGHGCYYGKSVRSTYTWLWLACFFLFLFPLIYAVISFRRRSVVVPVVPDMNAPCYKMAREMQAQNQYASQGPAVMRVE